ncbi:MAG TPA: nuclear transport factor 2 family protein [Actinomycetota bacterium]|nr:nuclear transport factor 2 family protein [Actinomycetota bacterium]
MSILTKTFTRKRSTHVTTASNDAVVEFLDAFGRRDVDTAVAQVADDVRITAHGLGLREQGTAAIREILEDIARAFPDLLVTTKRILRTGDVLTAELKVEGTQAAPYAGAINQEKHLDLDEAWRFEVRDGRIVAIDAYWCQQQLYRRLGVKRFDQIAIV